MNGGKKSIVRSQIYSDNKRNYGWKPDLPDHRDHRFAACPAHLSDLPTKVDLRAKCPPVLNQGQLGSCTAHAIANAHLFDQMRQKADKPFLPSRLFIYYNEREMENCISSDGGAMIRDGIKSIAKKGVCPESMWPYDPARFKTKPSAACVKEALDHQAVSYQRITPVLNQLKGCLAAGNPFVFGFSVYDEFEGEVVAKSGLLHMPGSKEKCRGGHAVLAVGYDDRTQRFTIMNSWGEDWGKKGFFTMPYAYLTSRDLADDFWTVQTVEA